MPTLFSKYIKIKRIKKNENHKSTYLTFGVIFIDMIKQAQFTILPKRLLTMSRFMYQGWGWPKATIHYVWRCPLKTSIDRTAGQVCNVWFRRGGGKQARYKKLCTTQMTKHWICTSVSTWTEKNGSLCLHIYNSAYFKTRYMECSYLLSRWKNWTNISKWRESESKASYGKVKNYCTLHRKATARNKKHNYVMCTIMLQKQ
jgi:hypothetical protein